MTTFCYRLPLVAALLLSVCLPMCADLTGYRLRQRMKQQNPRSILFQVRCMFQVRWVPPKLGKAPVPTSGTFEKKQLHGIKSLILTHMLTCQGKTPFKLSNVAKFPLRKYISLRKDMNTLS